MNERENGERRNYLQVTMLCMPNAESTNVFKTRLDKFLSNEEIFYDYHVELQTTLSRSVITRNCFRVSLIQFLNNEETGKEATRWRS